MAYQPELNDANRWRAFTARELIELLDAINSKPASKLATPDNHDADMLRIICTELNTEIDSR